MIETVIEKRKKGKNSHDFELYRHKKTWGSKFKPCSDKGRTVDRPIGNNKLPFQFSIFASAVELPVIST